MAAAPEVAVALRSLALFALSAVALSAARGAAAAGVTAAGGPCKDVDKVDLEFTSVSSSNLAGQGPDTSASPNIRYLYVAQVGGLPVDLVVEAVDKYNPRDTTLNGQKGPYGRINLRAGARSNLRISFRRSGTSAHLTMRSINFTFFDLDFHSRKHLAMVKVRNHSAARLPSGSELWQEASDGELTCEVGDKVENAMVFSFDNASQISLQLEVAEEAGDGRNFYFSASACDERPIAVASGPRPGPAPAPNTSDDDGAAGSKPDDGALNWDWGAESPDGVEFNCSAGFENWQSGWSDQKKAWCCEHGQVGCTSDNLAAPSHVGAEGTATEDQWCLPRAASSCSGREVQLSKCEGLPKCSTSCEPRNCAFGDWADWAATSDCSGLCERRRKVRVANNECGAPCKGASVETSARSDCMASNCTAQDRNCTWDAWEDWAPCSSSDAQSFRSRLVKSEQQGSGEPCVGGWKETRPCGGPAHSDCAFADWGDWTACSASCGGGVRSQVRRVGQRAAHGGAPCEGPTSKVAACGSSPCEAPVNCSLGDWGDWVGCNSIMPTQKVRTREIARAPRSTGAPCKDALQETAGCTLAPLSKCEFDEWSEWSECTVSCGGGQTERMRSLVHRDCALAQPEQGADLRQAKECGTQPCDASKCELADWGDWEDCSVTCGDGRTSRKRSISGSATVRQLACVGALEEVRNCSTRTDCPKKDCEWGDWSNWGACTATCGGGAKRRDRNIKTTPSSGGKTCSAEVKSEMAPCSTKPCDNCVDGAWGSWDEWSPCTATCGPAFRVRHREVAKYANQCGTPASGEMDQFQLCLHLEACTPAQDCEISDWSPWAACSSKCYGVSERGRTIDKNAENGGMGCTNESLREIVTCNPGPGEHAPEGCKERALPSPCEFEPWGDWGACSATCNVGQRTRQRHAVPPHGRQSEPCSGPLAETQPCGEATCNKTCQDCLWGDWDDWGACSRYGGQRFRHRSVERTANECGKPCTPGRAKEVQNCTNTQGAAAIRYCVWAPWSAESQCDALCGPATRTRQRQLRTVETKPNGSALFFEGSTDSACSGAQISLSTCHLPSCDPGCKQVDCRFAAWSQWSAPTCEQLCERHRMIEHLGACGGAFCEGPFVETKRCPRNCEKLTDCELGDWTDWSGLCDDLEEQRSRTRVIRRNASFGGAGCQGALLDTKSCRTSCTPRDCEVASWSQWGSCSRSCGGGVRMRSRHIAAEAACGGSPCTDSLEQLKPCGLEACGRDQDCLLSEFGHWGACSATGQQTRERKVLREASGNGGSCTNVTKESRRCGADVDCEVTPWTAWDKCDATCGGGQQQRHRQVTRNPLGRGRACPPTLDETRGCSQIPCALGRDCEVSDWAAWGECSAACGRGSRSRDRIITQLPTSGGAGCNLALSQLVVCFEGPCERAADTQVDCVWETWSEWSECDSQCGGGQRVRSRNISALPQHGGRPCEALDPEETEPCNTQLCSEDGEACVDAKWGDWTHWEACSLTCQGGGITKRTRKVAKKSNHCGRPATGLSSEAASCNEDVQCELSLDCSFEDWQPWGTCSQACDGVQNRSRDISVGTGAGALCEGSLKQSRPCSSADAECNRTRPLLFGDSCQFEDWSGWSKCPCTCGTCQQNRSRGVLGGDGASGCHGALVETKACGTTPCLAKCGHAVDCKWSDWSDWGDCDVCGGQRNRSRHVARPPACGGKPCSAGAAEEVGGCPRSCGTAQKYCSWAGWEPWSSCSATCGSAFRKRERSLQATEAAPAHCNASEGNLAVVRRRTSMQGKFEVLHRRAAALEARRWQELGVAFTLGCAAILVVPLGTQVVWQILRRSVADRARHVQPVLS